jgi:hypothetical protein
MRSRPQRDHSDEPTAVTDRTHTYNRLHDVVKEVDWARLLVGFHFRNSDLQGTSLGRKVARYVTDQFFQSVS